jgi:hypothetical protein
MSKFNFKQLIPYVAAVLIFAGITIAYFNPLLEGKKLKQSDITQWKGMSKEISDYRAKTGEEALWTNSMFGGMPAYQISVVYKGNLMRYIDSLFQLYLPHPAGLVFLYLLGFFILLLVLNVDIWLAVAGSIAFAFSSYFFIILIAGHNSKAHAIGYMAPVLAGIILTYRGKYLVGGAISALFLALELYTNHMQITYYLMLIVFIYAISELVRSIKSATVPNFLKASVVLGIAALLAVGTSASNLWSTYEYGKETIRGKTELSTEKSNRTSGLDKDYATDWSYGIGETFTLLIPDARGGASNGSLTTKSATYSAMINNGATEQQASEYIQNMPLYWGPQISVAGPVYLGAIVIFLFILALMVADNKYKWWLLAATILSILLAWGKNFMPFTDFFLTYVPGYNKFRAVSMAMVIAEFAIPLLALLGLQRALSGEVNKKILNKYLLYALGITGGISILFAIAGTSFFNFISPSDEQYKAYYPDWLMNAIRLDRASLLQSDAIRSFGFIFLAAGVIWAFINGKLKKQYAYPLLIILMLTDVWIVDHRYLNKDSFVRKSIDAVPFQPSQADLFIMKDVDPNYRVFNQTVNPFQDAGTSYFHKSLGGYHGAKLRRYQEIIEHDLSKGNMNVFNMLNTKYFITSDKANNNQPMMQVNMQALGNAWFVSNVRMVKNADEEIAALDNFNPSQTAIVDKRFEAFVKGHDITKDTLSVINLTSYKPNELIYECNSKKEQLAVFSEIYYDKGWNAYVDGKLTPHFRVNYILRAMVLPAGKHKVEFRFEPRSYKVGEKISLASSLLLILLVIGSFGLVFRAKASEGGNESPKS